MKKKLALLLSAVMVVGMVPATAFAVTTNTVSRIASGTTDTTLTKTNAPVFTIEEKNLEDVSGEIAFKVTLKNAEWNVSGAKVGTAVEMPGASVNGDANDESGDIDDDELSFQMLSSTQAILSVKNFTGKAGSKISFPILSDLTDEGEATLSIDPMDSVVSAGTYKFANVVKGGATVSLSDTVAIKEGTTEIKTITLEEATAGSMKEGELKFKLSSDFEWEKAPKLVIYPENSGLTIEKGEIKDETLTYQVKGASTKAVTATFTGGKIRADFDDVKVGERCDLTVSGAGITKTTLELGTATDYSVSLSVENKTVPTFYSGRRSDDVDSLKVTLKENIANSWIAGRKTTLTFPEGVKIMDVDVKKNENVTFHYTADENELKFTDVEVSKDKKAKIEMVFRFSIAPDFTGDIEATLSGAGIGKDQKVVVGTVEKPITIKAETNKVAIDYRNVSVGDILITETFAGALQKGKTLSLELDTIKFDGDPKVEVVKGDIKIDKVETNNGKINITIDKESAKTPATLKITNIQLFLDRSLPAGTYALKLVAFDPYQSSEFTNSLGKGDDKINGDVSSSAEKESKEAYFQTSAEKGASVGDSTLFDNRSITVLKDYVEVVTAGRDQDDSTFTTKVKVTVGANVMYAGDKEIALDVPAYISNGYTMMPVRAVTEALSGSAIVRWDDVTKTVTITFGSRVISMSVGSNTMLINGVPVQMQAAVEITGERAFIPLRDLGYALGLNDSKIAWDDATKTASLN